ncbi:pyridoxamine 5'-phosphate oxidase-domain-containing protein [Crucibulum laeve]|uniref:Pyridoxamine 5'-phosphate oxidase-domain-containing protein n=1 Tax=Crucibulum laeve TaxID=68775 RepID=A0A5C3MIA1_9AGAR|nr:pyridoxamine 5'-phosphate oxidase-domain-containing protein [Crucibulum laeve]
MKITLSLAYSALFYGLSFAYETVEEAAVIARSLVDHSADFIGTMATTFPSNSPILPGQPFSLQEYYASCHHNGSLTLLFLPISRHSRNILASPGRSASISITSEIPAASRARLALIGNVTIFEDLKGVPDVDSLQRCYLERHPDAKRWLPDDEDAAHISYWARFDPHSIYFVGGFGGEHYIGFIPLPMYQAVGDIERSSGGAGTILLQD